VAAPERAALKMNEGKHQLVVFLLSIYVFFFLFSLTITDGHLCHNYERFFYNIKTATDICVPILSTECFFQRTTGGKMFFLLLKYDFLISLNEKSHCRIIPLSRIYLNLFKCEYDLFAIHFR